MTDERKGLDLEPIKRAMSARDHLTGLTPESSVLRIYQELADHVPDLTAEVERLSKQAEECCENSMAQARVLNEVIGERDASIRERAIALRERDEARAGAAAMRGALEVCKQSLYWVKITKEHARHTYGNRLQDPNGVHGAYETACAALQSDAGAAVMEVVRAAGRHATECRRISYRLLVVALAKLRERLDGTSPVM